METATKAALDLTTALQNLSPATPFVSYGDAQLRALEQLPQIFKSHIPDNLQVSPSHISPHRFQRIPPNIELQIQPPPPIPVQSNKITISVIPNITPIIAQNDNTNNIISPQHHLPSTPSNIPIITQEETFSQSIPTRTIGRRRHKPSYLKDYTLNCMNASLPRVNTPPPRVTYINNHTTPHVSNIPTPK